MKRYCVPLIPALNPPDCLISIVAELKTNGFENIIVVDDGSSKGYQRIYTDLRDHYSCDLLVNEKNMGQGHALKAGMDHYLRSYREEYKGVITFDCDGQHLVKDAIRIDDEMGKENRALILGVRDLMQENVPTKSKIGNRITRKVMQIVTGGNIKDTQTGLRGIPNNLVYEYLSVPGDHFEYNTVMLLESIRRGVPIKEIPIETVYFDNNRATHFRPVRDSFLIYRAILGFRNVSSDSVAETRTSRRVK